MGFLLVFSQHIFQENKICLKGWSPSDIFLINWLISDETGSGFACQLLSLQVTVRTLGIATTNVFLDSK